MPSRGSRSYFVYDAFTGVMAGSLGVPRDLVLWHGQRLGLWSILLGGPCTLPTNLPFPGVSKATSRGSRSFFAFAPMEQE
jgi:hypothetical protein